MFMSFSSERLDTYVCLLTGLILASQLSERLNTCSPLFERLETLANSKAWSVPFLVHAPITEIRTFDKFSMFSVIPATL